MTPRAWRWARPWASAPGVSVALYVAARGERLFAGGVGSALTSMNPRAELIGRPVGHAVAFGLLGFAGFKGLQHVFALGGDHR